MKIFTSSLVPLLAAGALVACGFAMQRGGDHIVGVTGSPAGKTFGARTPKGYYLVQGARPVANSKLATFAGGCFWGIEEYMRHEPGVIATAVGFSGGHVANPSYHRVCDGDTGHAETCVVEFDPAKTSFEKLAKTFFSIIDPTEVNAQGPDHGTQYRSVVFYHDDEQKAATLKLISALEKGDFKGEKIATQVVPAGPFYFAEDYHQQWVEKGGTAYCHTRTKRNFNP